MKTKIDRRFPMARRLQNKTNAMLDRLDNSPDLLPEYVRQAYLLTNATVGALYSAAVVLGHAPAPPQEENN